ncbi:MULTISPECIES: GTP-binding protein [unclassified Bradyrhizobium]|uniref:GTP-binding protein n=1 Tax=unclassified Bradyrhizobium TaxID=2631580 RepID=UPI0028EDA2E5|nr:MULTISPECIES: GTP-binding protein [unclassified Bradyrhizobium]
MRLRFQLVGGFLGAGKTSTIARLASMHMRHGRRVGIVTNDQAAALVDTRNLEMRGLTVAEVAGACFCCRFDELAAQIRNLTERAHPDIVIAEPVGSCTDLVATVIRPLQRFYAGALDVAPFLVVLKPSLARTVLSSADIGATSNVGYIFRKQLEEAKIILINRCDELLPAEIERLVNLVKYHFLGATPIIGSARNGQGFDTLFDMLERRGTAGDSDLNIDYERYAAGEAELGWLNANLRVAAARPFRVDEALTDLIEDLRISLDKQKASAAHIKVMGASAGGWGVANWVGAGAVPELSHTSGVESREVELTINARVVMDPKDLESVIQASVKNVVLRHGGQVLDWSSRSFRPGRPFPTHRLSS